MAINEGLQLNGLDLNNGTTRFLTALTLPIPRKRPEWIEGVDADGALLMRDPLVSNGQLVATIDLYGSSKDNGLGLIGEVVDQLEEADRNPGGIPLVWTPADGTKTLTFYVLTGEITELPQDMKWIRGKVASVTLTLDCRPGGYGPRALYGTATVAGPIASVNIPDFPGDMPSDEVEVIITDMSSQSRRHVEWGMEQRYYNPAAPWPVIVDSDSLITTGFAGTQTVGSGAYDPNASGNNAISATLFPTPIAVCGTGMLTHIGTFRVKARVQSSSADSYVRLAWRVGDGSYEPNAWIAAGVAGQWNEIDLGLISIPSAAAGSQAWDGRIEAYGAITVTLFVDYILLLPAGEGYGRARAEYVEQPGTVVAYDTFLQTAGALTGKTLPIGGTWAGAGDADDFNVNGTGLVTRAAVNDANEQTGRYGLAGATAYTACAIQARVGWPLTSYSLNNPVLLGVLARYVDTNNWLIAVAYITITADALVGNFQVRKRVAGTVTTLATVSSGTVAFPMDIRLSAAANGAWRMSVNDVTTASGADAVLATGGALASGRVGIYDACTMSTATPREFDDFYVSDVPVSPVALYSGRTIEIRSADTIRQNSAGTTYGRPPSYRGSRPILQPAGVEDRTTRVVAKAHRNDVEIAEANNVTDSLKIEIYARPRYSTVPR